ncbi:MAG: response regulator [Betaproteobacteria bacterium]|nr:response regulator [Betaproteobacteria bacterium]
MPSDHARRDIVLVVDDAPDTLSLLTDALEAADMTVLVATDGLSAIERVGRITPDVVLLDAVMPGMDGFETCASMRLQPAMSQVPIIFMTGLADTEHVVRGFEAGGVDYVTKPIDPDALIARIRTHVATARRMSSARAALDAAGRALVALASSGEVRWHTPRADRFVAALGNTADRAQTLRMPPEIVTWLAQTRTGPSSRPLAWPSGEPRFTLATLGSVGDDEYLVAVSESDDAEQRRLLAGRFQLTDREAEVLIWIARGKSSRDVGEILGLSPRTVDKHLERIFVKLGVENRAAATALAISAFRDA